MFAGRWSNVVEEAGYLPGQSPPSTFRPISLPFLANITQLSHHWIPFFFPSLSFFSVHTP